MHGGRGGDWHVLLWRHGTAALGQLPLLARQLLLRASLPTAAPLLGPFLS